MEKLIYEYCIIRYVPDIERGEFLNVGLLMLCKRYKWLRSEIKISQERIGRMRGRLDVSLLEKQLKVFVRKDVPSPGIPVEEKYRWLAAVKSAIIQTSPSHPGILYSDQEDASFNLESKFEDLFCRLVK